MVDIGQWNSRISLLTIDLCDLEKEIKQLLDMIIDGEEKQLHDIYWNADMHKKIGDALQAVLDHREPDE